MVKPHIKTEIFLAVIIALLLIASLLSEKYLHIPPQLTSLLILLFIAVKIFNIIAKKGTIFEDYIALSIIVVFGVIHYLLESRVSPLMIVAFSLILLYSIGLIPRVGSLTKSRNLASFIFSYGFFIFIIIFLFAGIYSANPTEFIEYGKPTALSFEDSLYFSTITFTTVGYGEISPLGINRLVSSIEGFAAVILNIAFIGYILASRNSQGIYVPHTKK